MPGRTPKAVSSFDPTEPSASPGAVAELSEVAAAPDGVRVAGGSLAILEDDGVRGSGLAGVAANSGQISDGERPKLTDSRTAKYRYLESVRRVLVQKRVVDGDVEIGVAGKQFAVGARCELPERVGALPDAPLEPCEYDYSGFPKLPTAKQLIDIVQNPPSEPPVEVRDT